MRLHEYGHKLIYQIRQDIPAEHRPALLAYLAGSFDPQSGEVVEVGCRIDVGIRCEDCVDQATVACETCPVLQVLEK